MQYLPSQQQLSPFPQYPYLGNQTTKKTSSKGIFLVFGGIVILVAIFVAVGIGVGIYFILRKKNNDNSSSTSSSSSSSSSSTTQNVPGSTAYGNTTANEDFIKCRQVSPPQNGTTSFKMLPENEIIIPNLSFSYRTNLRGDPVNPPVLIFYDQFNATTLDNVKEYFAIGNYGFKGLNVSSTKYGGSYKVYQNIEVLFCSNGASAADILTGKGRLTVGNSYPVKAFSTEKELYSYFGI
jgi:hypothetical protein